MSAISSHQKSILALGVVYLVWGTTMAAIHIGVTSIPPMLLACSRFLLAGVLLMGYCFIKGEGWPMWREVKSHFMIGFLLFFGGNALSCWALQTLSTGLAGMLVATTPFWMLWMSMMLSKRDPGTPNERISPRIWGTLLLGFAGMLVLLSPQMLAPEMASTLFWSSLLAMVVLCLFWSAGSIYARHHRGDSSVLMGLGIQNGFAGLLLIPVCGVTHSFEGVLPSMASVWALLYLTVFGTIVTTPCYYYVLKHMPVSLSSSFAFVNPVITLVFGCLFLNEPFTVPIAVGSAIVVTAVFLLQVFSRLEQDVESRDMVSLPPVVASVVDDAL